MPLTSQQSALMLRRTLQEQEVFIGLFTEAPARDGTGGVEVSAPSYSRIPITFDITGGTPSIANNSGAEEFPGANEAWGVVTTGVIFTADGDRVSYSPFVRADNPDETQTRDVQPGDVLRIATGSIQVQLGG